MKGGNKGESNVSKDYINDECKIMKVSVVRNFKFIPKQQKVSKHCLFDFLFAAVEHLNLYFK